MSSVRERLLEIWQPTDEFRRLVEKAAIICREQTISAEDKPVTKLETTRQCEDVQKEFGKSYQKMIENDSSTAKIFDPRQSKLHWIPATFVLTGGSFRIPHNTSAIAIPLVKECSPRIEYYDAHGISSVIDWDVGSLIYMDGKSSLRSDGCGNASCILFVFKKVA
ncbi:uncharacterized protein RAG0_17542 [Rhynchosporium agropyri]|uniref:Uncharacterized protein n=1 Tax=Rhynchosporium agropyri TaxID=914238 RepID=A0A1E1LU25_9HELO|nr:uncharacterized protein RAG0_17542 [Rhynchosporium agropyri]